MTPVSLRIRETKLQRQRQRQKPTRPAVWEAEAATAISPSSGSVLEAGKGISEALLLSADGKTHPGLLFEGAGHSAPNT